MILLDSPYTERRFEAALECDIFEKGDSLAELANEIGLADDALAETVSHVNDLAERGEPDDFNHHREQSLQPPYYGTKVKPAVIENSGGLRTDTSGRVVDESATPIENLYAAGSVTAGIGGLDAEQYIPGMRMLNVLTLSKIMGREAATDIRERRP